MRFTPLQLGSRARMPMVGVVVAAWLLLSSPENNRWPREDR